MINGIEDDGVSWVKMRQARQDLYVRENHMCQGLEGPVNKRLLKNVKYIEAGEKIYNCYSGLCVQHLQWYKGWG